jgi:uncharacterized YccA/Bax inhibitor family protein
MASALPARSGNPVLSDAFRATRVHVGEDAMTIEGAVNKTALALLLLVAAAAWTWRLGPAAGPLVMVGVLGGFVLALATTFRPTWSPITAPLYAVLEGLALGAISRMFELRYPGLVSQAVFCTFGTLGAMLIAYRAGWVQATDRFKMMVATATGGIALVYFVAIILSLFHVSTPIFSGGGPLGIAISVFVVGVAALNLVLDFDLIETGAERGAPKYMEWYSAFALLVTLVWLYLELLRLLSRLQERR